MAVLYQYEQPNCSSRSGVAVMTLMRSMMRAWLVLGVAELAVGRFERSCPSGLTLQSRFQYGELWLMACEDLAAGLEGAITFVAAEESHLARASGYPLTIYKRTSSNAPLRSDDAYLGNLTKHDVLNATSDVMGNRLLGVHGYPRRDEPTLTEVSAAIPPLRHLGSWGGSGARVWTASRGSIVDCVLDENGENHLSGLPLPRLVASRLPGPNGTRFTAEGLLGETPALLLGFPTLPGVHAWEMSVVPVPNHTGFTQPVFVRFLQINQSRTERSAASAEAGTERSAASAEAVTYTARALYFDTFAYVPSLCADDALADCAPAGAYFGALLDNHFFWEATWRTEGRMGVALPRRDDTDGALLLRQAQHALLLDMITRQAYVWPRYGTFNGYEQEGVGANGFQDVLVSSMMASLEWGLHEYARDVLHNWLEFYQRPHGAVLYRGLEMPQQGRLLTIVAMYFRYTRDAMTVLEHLPKLDGVVTMLLDRRRAALARYPNASDPRHGMPTGNDEADLWWATTAGGQTELPFVSIMAEAWRGLRDCGEALGEMAETLPAGHAGLAAAARLLSARMVAEAPGMLADLRASLARSAFVEPDGAVCHPYVAGERTCGELPSAASSRDSEPWRTYAEALYSGAIPAKTVAEVLAWHQTQRCASGSRLKLGILTGSGGDVSNGDVLETFTLAGWGYGLLAADLTEAYLLQWLAVSAHGYTRGTHIAPESSYVDRTAHSPSFATHAGLVAPLYLKWSLVVEAPLEHALWLTKATPRVWLAEGEVIELMHAPTAYGRLGIRLKSAIRSAAAVHVNLSLPPEWATKKTEALPTRQPYPAGGLRVRVRVPGARRAIRSVTVGGEAWWAFDATLSTVVVNAQSLGNATVLHQLSDVWVHF